MCGKLLVSPPFPLQFILTDLPLIFSDLLLTILDSKDLDEQRSTVSSANTALAVLFPHHQRDGTFSALVTFLLSSGNRYPTPWMIHYTDGSPTCLCRNCVKLTIPECAGSVTLINSSVFFEAHVNAPGPWLRFYIREAIFTGAAAILNCEKNPAIVCPCKVGDSHVATVKPDRELWICKKNPEKWGALQHSHKEWFESTGPQQPTPRESTVVTLYNLCSICIRIARCMTHFYWYRARSNFPGFQGRLLFPKVDNESYNPPLSDLSILYHA